MTVSFRSDTHHAPARLEQTSYGFLAHPLSLSSTQRQQHRAVMDATLDDRRIQAVLSHMERNEDYGTRTHCLGVGWVAVAAALKLGMDTRDAGLVARGSIGHDIGKEHDLIQPIVHSSVSFADNPRLAATMRHHAVWGALMLRDFGFGPNESMMAASHHGFQTDPDRPSYGITGADVIALPEADGYVPPTQQAAQILAAVDPLHALSVVPSVNGRNYLQDSDVTPLRAVQAVEQVAVDDPVRQAVLDAVGYSDLRHAA